MNESVMQERNNYAIGKEPLTDMTIGQIWVAIRKLPSSVVKWSSITDEQLSEWFVQDGNSITVRCELSDSLFDTVTRIKIYPSKVLPEARIFFRVIFIKFQR